MTDWARIGRLWVPQKFLRAENDTLQQAYDRLATNFRAIQAWAHQLLENPHTHDIDTELTGDLNSAAANASGDLVLTTSYQDVAGASITLDKNGTWLVWGAARVAGNNATADIKLVVEGVDQAGILGAGDNSSAWTQMPSRVWKVAVTDQPDTAKLQAKKDAGTSATVKATDTTIAALWIGN